MPVESDERLRALRATLWPGHPAHAPKSEGTHTGAADLLIDEVPDPSLERMEAAVALVVRAGEQLDFLLIKRAVHECDPWSGQMALPGGRWETDDSGLLHTAVRETFEETGLDLTVLGAPMGRLEDVAPSSPHLPKMRIAPFVFGVPAGAEARVASHELESVHWVPLDVLAAPATAATTRIQFSGFSKTFPSYHVVGEHVWGLTHRILTAFLERYPR
jgi:8-oxo-dGTP pyrophosphatase MutT (NUDIX family)